MEGNWWANCSRFVAVRFKKTLIKHKKIKRFEERVYSRKMGKAPIDKDFPVLYLLLGVGFTIPRSLVASIPVPGIKWRGGEDCSSSFFVGIGN